MVAPCITYLLVPNSTAVAVGIFSSNLIAGGLGVQVLGGNCVAIVLSESILVSKYSFFYLEPYVLSITALAESCSVLPAEGAMVQVNATQLGDLLAESSTVAFYLNFTNTFVRGIYVFYFEGEPLIIPSNAILRSAEVHLTDCNLQTGSSAIYVLSSVVNSTTIQLVGSILVVHNGSTKSCAISVTTMGSAVMALHVKESTVEAPCFGYFTSPRVDVGLLVDSSNISASIFTSLMIYGSRALSIVLSSSFFSCRTGNVLALWPYGPLVNVTILNCTTIHDQFDLVYLDMIQVEVGATMMTIIRIENTETLAGMTCVDLPSQSIPSTHGGPLFIDISGSAMNLSQALIFSSGLTIDVISVHLANSTISIDSLSVICAVTFSQSPLVSNGSVSFQMDRINVSGPCLIGVSAILAVDIHLSNSLVSALSYSTIEVIGVSSSRIDLVHTMFEANAFHVLSVESGGRDIASRVSVLQCLVRLRAGHLFLSDISAALSNGSRASIQILVQTTYVECQFCMNWSMADVDVAQYNSSSTSALLHVNLTSDASNFSGFGSLVAGPMSVMNLFCNRWNRQWLTKQKIRFSTAQRIMNVTSTFPRSLSEPWIVCPLLDTGSISYSTTASHFLSPTAHISVSVSRSALDTKTSSNSSRSNTVDHGSTSSSATASPSHPSATKATWTISGIASATRIRISTDSLQISISHSSRLSSSIRVTGSNSSSSYSTSILLSTFTRTISKSITSSQTCEDGAGRQTFLARNMSGLALGIESVGDLVVDGGIVSMTSMFHRGGFWVRLTAKPGVYMIVAGNASARTTDTSNSGTVASNLGRVVSMQLVGPLKSSRNGTDILVSAVEFAVAVAPSDMSRISLAVPFALSVHFYTRLTGRCIPVNFSAALGLAVTLTAPKNASLASIVASRTAVSTAAASSVLSNLLSALTTVSMVSLLQISSCMFSDVDPLDSDVSPLQVSLGPDEGQYYRGAVVVALMVHLIPPIAVIALALALVRIEAVEGGIPGAFYSLRFPSVMLFALPIFLQGMVTSAVSLIRMNIVNSGNSTSLTAVLDVLSATTALACASCVIIVAFRATTRPRFQCRLETAAEAKEKDGGENDGEGSMSSRAFRVYFSLATWRMHWVDASATGLFKRRYMLLMDDMALPWWSAVELASCAMQGAVLGLRLNDPTICQAQQIVLLVHCAISFAGAMFFRPRGSHLAQLFLIAGKVGAMLVSLFVLVYTLTGDDTYVDMSESVAAGFSALSSLEPISFVVVTCISKWPTVMRFVRRIQYSLNQSRIERGGSLQTLICDREGPTGNLEHLRRAEGCLLNPNTTATAENQASRSATLAQLATAELRAALTDEYISHALQRHTESVDTTLAYLIERASLVAALRDLRHRHLKSIPPQGFSDQ